MYVIYSLNFYDMSVRRLMDYDEDDDDYGCEEEGN